MRAPHGKIRPTAPPREPATINTGGGCDARLRLQRSAANSGQWRAAGYAPGAVLRFGLRLRCDAALPPAAGAPEPQRSAGNLNAVSGGVGCGSTQLGSPTGSTQIGC